MGYEAFWFRATLFTVPRQFKCTLNHKLNSCYQVLTTFGGQTHYRVATRPNVPLDDRTFLKPTKSFHQLIRLHLLQKSTKEAISQDILRHVLHRNRQYR